MLYSKPYNYYHDKDYQNLNQKIKYSIKQGFAGGVVLAVADIQYNCRPRSFAHMGSIFGKWTFLTATAMVAHSCLTYAIANYRQHDGGSNHFWSGIANGIVFSPILQTNYAIFVASVITGAWAAYSKDKWKKFNTGFIGDPAFIHGTGGLYNGAFSTDYIFDRYIFKREDPGRRESERY